MKYIHLIILLISITSAATINKNATLCDGLPKEYKKICVDAGEEAKPIVEEINTCLLNCSESDDECKTNCGIKAYTKNYQAISKVKNTSACIESCEDEECKEKCKSKLKSNLQAKSSTSHSYLYVQSSLTLLTAYGLLVL